MNLIESIDIKSFSCLDFSLTVCPLSICLSRSICDQSCTSGRLVNLGPLLSSSSCTEVEDLALKSHTLKIPGKDLMSMISTKHLFPYYFFFMED